VDQGRDSIVGATIAESLHLVMWRSRADSAPASQLSFFRLSVERAQAGEGSKSLGWICHEMIKALPNQSNWVRFAKKLS
jgi:hypothetical protein